MSPRVRRGLPLGAAACFSAGFLLWASAGRLFPALVAIAGVASLGFALARLVDRQAAAYGVATFATMPLAFVQTRATLGSVGALSANAAAFAGLAVAMFDRHRDARARWLGLVMAIAGLTGGALTRGALLGLAVPTMGVALAWLLTRRDAERDRATDALGLATLVAGCVGLAIGLRGVVGAHHPAFDEVLHHLGHSLFPWSALLPFASAALTSHRRANGADAASRTAVLTSAVVAFVAHSIGGGDRELVTFVAPAVLAAAIAIAARELDNLETMSGSGASEGLADRIAARSGGVVAALFGVLLAHDLSLEPRRALAAIVPLRAGAVLVASPRWVNAAALVLGSAIALAAFDRDDTGAPLTGSLLAWPRAIFEVWGGHLGTFVVATEAALVSLAVTVALRPASAFPLGESARGFAQHAFWLFPVCVVAPVAVLLLGRDAMQALRAATGTPRGAVVVVAGTLAGSLLAWGFYPALLAQAPPPSPDLGGASDVH